MKNVTGLIMLVLGAVILLWGNKQFSKYGFVSKWLFDPPFMDSIRKKSMRQALRWVLGGVLLYLGMIVIVGKM